MMQRFFSLLFFTIILILSNTVYAQVFTCGNLSIDSAEHQYDIGRFDDCVSVLTSCLQTKEAFAPEQKIQAYHLLAKCYLEMDSVDRADSVIEELLLLKDNFETDDKDPQRFINRVSVIKSTLVSSVSKRNEAIRLAPATTYIITAEEIFKRGYIDLIEILKDIPAFDVSIYYGQLYANVYQRGLRTNNTDKTLLLVDGVEENDLWSNFADISQQYPVTNIKRIEVIYGPASTMYGPNAFSGVINIITKDASDYLKNNKSLGVFAQTGVGTYGTRYFDASTAYKKGSFSFSITGRLYYSDRPNLSSQDLWDYNPEDYTDDNHITSYKRILSIKDNAKEYLAQNHMPYTSPLYRINRDTTIIQLSDAGVTEAIRLNQALYTSDSGGYTRFVNPSKSAYINAHINIGELSLGLVSWSKKEGNGTTFTDYIASVSKSRWITGHNYAYFKYTKRINDKLLFTGYANYRIHSIKNGSKVTTKNDYSAVGTLELKDLVNAVPASWRTTYYYESSEQFRAEFKLLYTHSKNFYLNSGIELRNSQLQGYFLTSQTSAVPQTDGTYPPTPGGNQYNVNDIGIYSQGNYRTHSGFGITLGARLDYDQVRKNEGLGYHISPRLVLDYTINDWVFKGIISHGIENVSNYTKFDDINIVPNPLLKPETIYNYEVSAEKKFSDAITADIDLYYSQIRNVVSGLVSDHILQNKNIGAFDIRGLQANFYYKPAGKKFLASLNYAYTHPVQSRSVDTLNAVVDSVLQVPDISPHKINASVNIVVYKYFNINFRLNYLSSKNTGIGTTAPSNKLPFPGFIVGNTSIIVQDFIKGISLQLGCNNVFNNHYFTPGIRTAGGVRVPNGILQMQRNFYLKINYEL